MLKSTLRRFLAFANDNVFSPIIPRIPMLAKWSKIRKAGRVIRKELQVTTASVLLSWRGSFHRCPIFNQFLNWVFLTWVYDQSDSSTEGVVYWSRFYRWSGWHAGLWFTFCMCMYRSSSITGEGGVPFLDPPVVSVVYSTLVVSLRGGGWAGCWALTHLLNV